MCAVERSDDNGINFWERLVCMNCRNGPKASGQPVGRLDAGRADDSEFQPWVSRNVVGVDEANPAGPEERYAESRVITHGLARFLSRAPA
jgi:hypothetical protein